MLTSKDDAAYRFVVEANKKEQKRKESRQRFKNGESPALIWIYALGGPIFAANSYVRLEDGEYIFGFAFLGLSLWYFFTAYNNWKRRKDRKPI